MNNNLITNFQTLRIDKVIKYDELDQGFILRANDEVTRVLRQMIKYGKEDEKMNLEILSLNSERRRFGLKINQTIFLATMVDLPCIIEAMKTLDNFNFYKSQDAS